MLTRNFITLMLMAALLSTVTGSAHAGEDTLSISEEEMGQTFTVETGTTIEVSLLMSDLHVSYDPTKLQFLSYSPPEVIDATVENGVILPDNAGDTAESSAGVGTPAQGETGLITATTDELMNAAPRGDEYRSTWKFLAIGAGETTVELRTFLPPCDGKTQPCIMMPEFLIGFNLVIEGEPIVSEPESVTDDVVRVTPEIEVNAEPFSIETGKILILDLPALEQPYRVIYHPAALTLLAGETPRFVVNPWGMTTFVGIQMSDGTTFLKYLLIPAERE